MTSGNFKGKSNVLNHICFKTHHVMMLIVTWMKENTCLVRNDQLQILAVIKADTKLIIIQIK